MSIISSFGEPVVVTRYPNGLQLKFSGPFVEGNIISLTVNNTPIAPVTFSTSSGATLAALAAAIAVIPGVSSAITQRATGILVQESRGVSITNIQITEGMTQSTSTLSGGFVSGRYVPPSPSMLTLLASIQPLTGRDLLNLGEGQRTKEHIRLYTDQALQTANEATGCLADVVTWQGVDYQVQQVSKWGGGLAHWKSMAVKVEQEA